MDVLTELLPPTYTGKPEKITKDSRRHRQAMKKSTSEANNTEEEKEDIPMVENRLGQDRRSKQSNRGRWLNSRSGIDRRRSNESAVFLKI